MNRPEVQIDDTDRAILRMLQEDAWIPLSTVAEKLGIANATVHLRLAKLREAKVVCGSHLHVDHKKLGFSLSAFVGIILHQASDYQKVLCLLEKLPEVTEAYYATGKYSILSKIEVRGIDELHAFLMKNLQGIREVQSTETLVILDAPIVRFREI